MAEHLSPIEKIKTESNALRGTIEESLNDELTGAIREDDQSLIKFHGM
jgi:sulfite reductase (NADPH) hemoprotein beta-component